MPSPKAGAPTQPNRPIIDFNLSKRFGHFPELTIEQNRVIWKAREAGWDVFYPSYPSAMSQAENTHRSAVKFLES